MSVQEQLQQAAELIDLRDYRGAIDLLETTEPSDAGERDALLGLALYKDERYQAAAEAYGMAVERAADPASKAEWQHLRAKCQANFIARVDQVVPPHHFFEREAVLARPVDPKLPKPGSPRHHGPIWAFRVAVGEFLGKFGTAFFDTATNLIGRKYSGELWTNWYRKQIYAGILTLAYMRNKLNKHNLRNTYPGASKVAFQPAGLKPPEGVSHFRTADGSWNNLDNPKEGAAGTRFSRNVRNEAIKPATGEELLTPNPRLVSQKLLRRKGPDAAPEMIEVPFLNLLAASWIQFQNHDWITHGENLLNDFIEVPLPEDDPARQRYRQSNMFISRTQPDPTRQAEGEETPVTFLNEVTHWWDGSQIYGSDQATQDRLRSHVDGKLTVTKDRTLPLGSNGVEDTGMVRNWWVGLAMFHNLFVLEHNSICDELRLNHPDWDDDRLFNVARLINAAVMAKIHSVEWTPAILANKGLDLGLNSNWYGLLTYRFTKGAKRETVAPYNIDNPELGGLVGNPINKHGAPFALAEEFVEVYRLHSLLPESLKLRNHANNTELEEVSFVETRQAGSAKLTSRVRMNDLFYSFGKQHPGQLVLNNYPRFMQELSIPGNPVFDMATVDILRARERGIPRYNEFRRQFGLKPIHSFADLTSDQETIDALNEVYEDVEQLDLMVGTLAEAPEHRPPGFGFGETMFSVFLLNASRRLEADRFYTDSYNEDVYTKEGLEWVDRTTLKKVLLRHHPELEATGLGNITNAFEPWDDGHLDPTRHPLRAFDPDLAKDPWRGEASD